MRDSITKTKTLGSGCFNNLWTKRETAIILQFLLKIYLTIENIHLWSFMPPAEVYYRKKVWPFKLSVKTFYTYIETNNIISKLTYKVQK